MRDAFVMVLEFVAAIAVTVLIVTRDVKRLPPQQLERAWPTTSIWSAVALLGPLCIPFHFMRTRRSLRGVGLGLAWLAGAGVALEAFGWLLETTLG
ncbi:MAG TPA: hypothetical protein VNN72_16970 [Polyangiaceae bacterium]|nr:hypothetical protein [Polyangiaceae bacterium]